MGCKAKTAETNIQDIIRNVIVDTTKVGTLHLSPANGSVYQYTTSNETTNLLEMDGNRMETITHTDVANTYRIHTDSNGNVVFNIIYENVKVKIGLAQVCRT